MSNLIVLIEEQYALKSDQHQWMLCKYDVRKDKKTGESVVYWEPFKYYGTLRQAHQGVTKHLLLNAGARSFKELSAAGAQIRALMESFPCEV